MKTVLVTGASSGIGFATATALLAKGWSVVMLARTREKAERACEAARKVSTSGEAHPLAAELAVLANVVAVAEEYKARFGRLDVLVNNAGINANSRVETADGVESNFAVNYLAPFLLTNLLLDRLFASAPSRIVNVSSAVEKFPRNSVDLSDLDSRRDWSPLQAYGRSKQALILFTVELARRLGDRGVTVNALHPGVIGTDIFREMPVAVRWISKVVLPVPEKGARTSVFLATSPEVDNVTGSYFQKSRVAKPSDQATDLVRARGLWDATVDLLESKGIPRSCFEGIPL